jgi:ATP-dependent DNA helicase RecG
MALRSEEQFRKACREPALTKGLIEITLPQTPPSSKQRYRLRSLGRR